MSKKVLILSGSPRKGGNSDLLCDEFMRGAMEAGNAVEKIRIQEKRVACFRGYAECVEGAVEKGIIYGTGVYHAGEIKDTAYMKEAYELGKNV